jgi:hypothetical protein
MALVGKYDYIEIDNVTFNDSEVRSVDYSSEKEQIPAGGFNTEGVDTTLSGARTSTVTCEFYADNTSGAMWQVLYPLHRDDTTFDFSWRPDMNAAVSATNPELRGSVKLPTWAQTTTFGEVKIITLTFVSQASNPLEYYYT